MTPSKKKLNFSEKKIISYYEDNKDDYKEIYKSVNLIELFLTSRSSI